MKKLFLVVGSISVLSLVACNQAPAPKKVSYEEFYQKIQEIENNHHNHATLSLTYFDDLSGNGETNQATLNYTWNTEQNKFLPDETYQFDLADEINRTIKDEFKRSEEGQDQKDMGYQYFIEPFKSYVDYTETIEQRTLRTIQSRTYNSYGYLTDYLLQVTANGTYQGKPLNGTQKTAYTISYR